ncbi:hypothetical protein ACKWRH_23525 [Bradyrhizobium sp. Pa8]|uniref:hypothetical protein n=1 Tax=Bradyrhizobium sp. Pa8 TaxID=3386552 RepID=UPI00403F3F97
MFPSNWYWSVAGLTGQVYSSKASNYVQETDPDYLEWLTQADVSSVLNTPTPIDTEFNLGGVLAPYKLEPIPANVLTGYQAGRADIALAEPLAPVDYDQENRIRALEGQPPLTIAQFRQKLLTL